MYHIPALLNECVDGLLTDPCGVYVDATFGGGGHSRALLSRLGAEGRLLAFDQDHEALANAGDLAHDSRFTPVLSNFRFLRNWLRFHGVEHVSGVLADLGVSFHHFDSASRGFSFRTDSPLDMRMNQRAAFSARDVVGNYSEERLGELLLLYGELRQGRRMAAAIVKAREKAEMSTTGQLADAVRPMLKRGQEKKELAQVFQALRIEVNHELDALKALLVQSAQVLKPGGRLAVLTYHSIEDRMVKNFIRSGNVEGKIEKDFFGHVTAPLKAVNNKVLTASQQEVERNPRARSAKLRIAEKIDG